MTALSNPDKAQYQAKYQPLLKRCQQMVSAQVEVLLSQMLAKGPETLIELAEATSSEEEKKGFFQTKSLLLSQRAAIEQGFAQEVAKGFARFWEPAPVTKVPLTVAALSLVSIVSDDAMEELVAVGNIGRKANIDLRQPLYGLKQRLSVLSGGAPISDEAIPGGPDHLAQAFNASLNALHIALAQRKILLRLFDRKVVPSLEPVYDQYNDLLCDEGVLPFLTHEIRNRGVDKAAPRPDPDSERHLPSSDFSGLTSQRSRETEPDTFDSLFDLMGKTSRSAARSGGDDLLPLVGREQMSLPVPGPALSPQDLATALDQALASKDEGTDEPDSAVFEDLFSLPHFELDDELLIRVDETLAAERHRFYRRLPPRQIKVRDAAAVELLGKLFQYLLQEPLLPPLAKALLSNLHGPYLKVAVLDHSLFTQAQHPARRVLDLLVEAGELWVNEEDLRHGIFPDMQQVVTRILKEFAEGSGLFDELLPYLADRVEDFRRGSLAIEKRTRNSAKGCERFELARQRATDKVATITRHPYLPPPAVDFLQRVWTDRLIFILLGQTETSRESDWKEALNLMLALARLCNPKYRADVTEPNLARLRDGLQAGLEPLGTQLRDKGQPLFDLLATPESLLAAVDALPPNPPSPDPAEPPASPALPAPSAQEQMVMTQLHALPHGTWFLWKDDHHRETKGKLTWISPVTATGILVDGSGQELRSVPLQRLVQEMLEGKTRLVENDGRPFFTRALASIQRRLREASSHPRETA